MVGNSTLFDGVHIFTPHADIPDDTTLRLIVLPMKCWYSKNESRAAFDPVLSFLRNNGTKPRSRANRLLFLGAEHATISRLNDAARVMLAWDSIVNDVVDGRLNIDLLQKNQAEKELKSARDVLPRVARECYRWLLCAVQEVPTDLKADIETFALNTGGSTLGAEIERVCVENELVIRNWSPIHLRSKLYAFYWKDGRDSVRASAFLEDAHRYLYMPRFQDRDVLVRTIQTGAASRDFFGTAYGQREQQYEGFQFGAGNVVFDDTLLLIEPLFAERYEEANRRLVKSESDAQAPSAAVGASTHAFPVVARPGGSNKVQSEKSFHGAAEIQPATAKMRFVQVAEEIVSVLSSDPNARIRITVEISAEFPDGVSDSVKRAVSENARALGLKTADWE